MKLIGLTLTVFLGLVTFASEASTGVEVTGRGQGYRHPWEAPYFPPYHRRADLHARYLCRGLARRISPYQETEVFVPRLTRFQMTVTARYECQQGN